MNASKMPRKKISKELIWIITSKSLFSVEDQSLAKLLLEVRYYSSTSHY